MDARDRRFLGSRGSQTPQSPAPSAPPMKGTPVEPPVPSRMTFTLCCLAEQKAKIRRRQISQRLWLKAPNLCQHAGGMGHKGRLVPLAPERNRRQIGCVGLDEQPL